ncbi:MAG: tyrosine-type recombinase/integrase [Actinomycetota bacterium]|nr:tyrosine-type recombinase/integrase [Actinomycetota bacterium]
MSDGRKANGKWIDRWREGGVQRQRTFDRKVDRDRFRTWRRRQAQLGLPVARELAPGVTLGEFVEDWWEQHALVDLEPSTRRTYAQVWAKHLHPRLAGYELRAITPDVVLDLRHRLHRRGVGDPTIVKALAMLQGIMAFAVLKGHTDTNPVARVRKPRQAPARQVTPIPPATVELLRHQLPTTRDRALVSVLAYAGLRPQEALALAVEDISDRSLFIHGAVADGSLRPYTKTRRHRFVRLLAALAQDLREYRLAVGIGRGLLFPRPDGAPWRDTDYRNWRRRVFQPAAKAAGLADAVPYDLRGSFVSLLIWEGQTIVEVSRQAGHSVATSDRHYARVFDGYDRAQRTSAEEAIRIAREQLAATTNAA